MSLRFRLAALSLNASLLLATSGCARSDSSKGKSDPPPLRTEPATASPMDDAGNKGPFIRDRAEVIVDGQKEVWLLEWRTAPDTVCIDPATFGTCACEGFAYGESGSLWLRRKQGDVVTEELPFDTLFADGKSKLVRWVPSADEVAAKKVGEASAIVARPVVPILVFADYDHDGQATEFLLQISSEPCGHVGTVAVGVDRHNPKLHVFSSVERNAQSLVLNGKKEWHEVRANKSASLLELACGDHGNKEELRFEVTSDDRGIHLVEKKRACN